VNDFFYWFVPIDILFYEIKSYFLYVVITGTSFPYVFASVFSYLTVVLNFYCYGFAYICCFVYSALIKCVNPLINFFIIPAVNNITMLPNRYPCRSYRLFLHLKEPVYSVVYPIQHTEGKSNIDKVGAVFYILIVRKE
jgi:hypothetical protein